jgi:hypothetical protein
MYLNAAFAVRLLNPPIAIPHLGDLNSPPGGRPASRRAGLYAFPFDV